MAIEVRVPTLGESVTEATVAHWLKGPGDAVEADEMVVELETDKVSVEVPAPASGMLGEIVAAEGATVSVDALLATLREGKAGGNGKRKATDRNGQDRAAPEAGEAGGESVDVTVPTLGESVTEATVASWAKSVGDTVARDEILCELETDKVSVEVPAPASGRLTEILIDEGGTVQAGGVLARIAAGGSSALAGDVATRETPAEAKPGDVARQGGGAPRDPEDGPAARKAMAEAGLTRDRVTGTGRDGRVMKEDVARAVADRAASPAPAARPPEPAPAPAPRAPVPAEDAGREERVKMTRLRRTIARRLKDAQNTAAMLTTYNEVDMTAVMDLRREYKDLFEKKHGVKLGFMSFFVKACCHALREVPDVNAEIDGDEIVYKDFVHMGVAVGTPSGLVVPVVRDADRRSFADIEKTIAELGLRARDGKISMAEMQGGTFTISNGGVYGSLMSAPILNPPQSGILGMHKIQDRPVVVAGQIVIRPMMYLALSYDHRIVDGKGAVTFLVRVKEALEDPRRLLMDL
jgi:2-oxoglutarate dehydrogenase E2 component (dihydrolipoamide succinyltransferase)